MFRLSALALLMPVLAVAAPVPKEKGKELYFPVEIGAKKVMQRTGGVGGAEEYTQTVTKVEEKDGVFTVTVHQESGGRDWPTLVYEVSVKGVFQKKAGGGKETEPAPLLKLPAKEGDTWEADQPKGTVTVGKEEEVEVPGGRFKAVKVEVTRPGGRGQSPKTTLWYAPGVGLVKQVIATGGADRVTELKAFTPGKVEKKDDKKKEEPKKDR